MSELCCTMADDTAGADHDMWCHNYDIAAHLARAEQRGYERAHEEQALAVTYQGDPEKYPEAYRAWQSTVNRSLASDLAASRQAGQREGYERAIEVLRDEELWLSRQGQQASPHLRAHCLWAAGYLEAVASSLVKGDSDGR